MGKTKSTPKRIRYRGAEYVKIAAEDPLGASEIMIDTIETHTKWSRPLIDLMQEMLTGGTLPEGGEKALVAVELGLRVASRAAYRSWSIMNALMQDVSPEESEGMREQMDEIEAASKTMKAW